jgi:hypothetical protein
MRLIASFLSEAASGHRLDCVLPVVGLAWVLFAVIFFRSSRIDIKAVMEGRPAMREPFGLRASPRWMLVYVIVVVLLAVLICSRF